MSDTSICLRSSPVWDPSLVGEKKLRRRRCVSPSISLAPPSPSKFHYADKWPYPPSMAYELANHLQVNRFDLNKQILIKLIFPMNFRRKNLSSLFHLHRRATVAAAFANTPPFIDSQAIFDSVWATWSLSSPTAAAMDMASERCWHT